MGSAHQLTERNICVKFNENHSMGSGDMRRHKVQGLITLSLIRDLDLESAQLSHGFCSLSHCD